MEPRLSRFVIAVIVPDRVGILRDVTSAVTDLGANIGGISQTVVEGCFTLTLVAAFDPPRTREAVRDALAANLRESDAAVVVLPHAPMARARRAPAVERYVITLSGQDRPGILKAVTAFLADRDINIADWFVGYDGSHVTYVGELQVPARLDIKQVQDECRRLMGEIGLTAAIQHENLFRATCEVGRVSRLLTGDSHAAHG